MTKPPIDLQDLRRRIYVKAKAEPSWRFWGLYVHVCKRETLDEAYWMAKKNNGAPGVDGVTFEAIEAGGVEIFLEQIRDELVRGTYRPLRNRKQAIPKGGGKVRVLSIPAIRDRVVQGALKLILEPVFEADFQDGSFGYRPKRTAHEAVHRVADAIVRYKTRVIDIDLKDYFDNVRHQPLLAKVAARVDDADVSRLLKMILKASGKKGVPQGGVITPPTMLQNRPRFPTLSFPERGSDRRTGTDGSPDATPFQGRPTAALSVRRSRHEHVPTEAHAHPSRRAPFRVHPASGSINRNCISRLDTGRVPPPGTAAVSVRSKPADLGNNA
jgi:Reverse transcriptase (RNA-dependent DNA polymerase)